MTGIPEQLAALARPVTGGITWAADRSWGRENSAVWEITDPAGGCWFVKRHSSERFHQREVAAYRHWTAGWAPRMSASCTARLHFAGDGGLSRRAGQSCCDDFTDSVDG